MSKLKRILPWVILCSAIAIPFWLPVMARTRAGQITDTGRTRPVVNQALAKLQALQPASLDDSSFRRAVQEAVSSQYVASIWLFTPDGRIVFRAGSQANPERFYEWATQEERAIISALAEGTLSDEQKGALLAAAALRGVGGGDHNDVWSQAVAPLKSSDGELVGWLGAVYDRSAESSAKPTPGFMFSVLFAFFLLAVYWLSVPTWVYLDAKSRGDRAWVWALFALIGNLAALIAYLLVRTPAARRTNDEP